jgi:hypothetical protein
MSITTQNSTTIYMSAETVGTSVPSLTELDEAAQNEEKARRNANYEAYMMMYDHEIKDGRYESAAYYQSAAQEALLGIRSC